MTQKSLATRFLQSVLAGLVTIVLLPVFGWAVFALWFDGPGLQALRVVLVAAFVLAVGGGFVFLRPLRRGFALAACCWMVVFLWWSLALKPSNDRN